MNPTRYLDGRLTLLDTPIDDPGFGRFFGIWIYQGRTRFVVDTGPATAAHRLVEYLRSDAVDGVDLVLVTHIHLDHAGGLAAVLESFPEAVAVCHERAVPYLVDPEPLWNGSKAALGELALSYGPIPPIARERLIPHTEADFEGLTVLATPGHAPHHLSFVYDGNLFAGEAGGVYLGDMDPPCLRPSTPPRFFLEKAVASIDLLMGLGDMPMYYGHFGRMPSSLRMLSEHRDQLFLWRDLVDRTARQVPEPERLDRCLERVLAEDPQMRGFRSLDSAPRERERFFLQNSLRGFLGYLGL